MTVESAESFCVGRGLDLDVARRTVAEDRKRITVAATAIESTPLCWA